MHDVFHELLVYRGRTLFFLFLFVISCINFDRHANKLFLLQMIREDMGILKLEAPIMVITGLMLQQGNNESFLSKNGCLIFSNFLDLCLTYPSSQGLSSPTVFQYYNPPSTVTLPLFGNSLEVVLVLVLVFSFFSYQISTLSRSHKRSIILIDHC